MSAQVVLWLVPLTGEVTPEDRALLDDDERARADRFVFDRDRRRYVRAHVALRTILARALGRDAGALRFVSDDDGKPRVQDGLSWNLSHSEEVAVVAVAPSGEIGVDVEVPHSIPDLELAALAERYFTASERDALFALDAVERERAFFRCWARKEACLKAVGAGLLLDTASFDCGVGVDERDVVIEWRGARRALRVATVDVSRELMQDADIAVAIAVEAASGARLAVDVVQFS